MYCVCVSEHTKRQLCHREKSITALGLYSVFPVVMSKENSTFTCHFSFPKWAKKKGRWGAPGPMGNNGHIQPPSSLALAMKSGKEQERWDVCPPLWLHMMEGRRFIYEGREIRIWECLRCGFGNHACFQIHNSTGCKGGGTAAGASTGIETGTGGFSCLQ